jgi:hypothetical protein
VRIGDVAEAEQRPVHLAGCRVLTRPSIISGKPVRSSTGITDLDAGVSEFSRLVPPVEIISIPSALKAAGERHEVFLVADEIRARRTRTS